MTLNTFNRGTICVRDKYKSLDDKDFVKLVSENMAKLYIP